MSNIDPSSPVSPGTAAHKANPVTDDENSVHSSISGDSQLDDHRDQHESISKPSNTNEVKKWRKRTNSHGSINGIKPMIMSEKPSTIVNINSNIASRDLISRMVGNGGDEDYDEYAVKFNDLYRNNNNNEYEQQGINFAGVNNTPAPLTDYTPGTKRRSKSFSKQVKSLIRPREESVGGILKSGNDDNNSIHSFNSLHSKKSGILYPDTLSRVASKMSTVSGRSNRSRRRLSNDDSDLDSHASRESQETEEDVCFPMVPEHIRIRGIDFDEIEEFIVEQREEDERIARRERELRMDNNHAITTSSARVMSSAALKYTPRGEYEKVTSSSESEIEKRGGDNNSFNNFSNNNNTNNTNTNFNDNNFNSNNNNFNNTNNNRYDVTFNPEGNIQEEEERSEWKSELPTRFSFFSSEMEETIHSADIPSLVSEGEAFKSLFEPEDSIWWLDCSCPTDNEMKMLAKAFSIHPLTAEDIRMQETREKVELFKSYYFVSFHTFETDSESEDFLEPINVYIVVFESGILTFHFSPIVNPANVRRRVRQLRDYVDVTADWLCYAMIDDITDGFAPLIQSLEYEADSIEDSVFLSDENDFGSMLLKIGESRRKVMTLMRLLQGKADVIKMFAKRCNEEAKEREIQNKNNQQIQNQQQYQNFNNNNNKGEGNHFNTTNNSNSGMDIISEENNEGEEYDSRSNSRHMNNMGNNYGNNNSNKKRQAKPSADIALYLGDIQDHIITMFQSLLSYEKIFSRSHSNYLAQLQVESFYSNLQVTDMLSKVTVLGTILVPMNLITGLFGMNVKIPGQDGSNYGWFGGIIGVIFLIVISSLLIVTLYLKHVENNTGRPLGSAASTWKEKFGRKRDNLRNNNNNRNQRGDAMSLPTRFTRYGDW